MKENFGDEKFFLGTVSKKDVLNLIVELPGNKATVSNDISVSVVKEAISTCHIRFLIFELDVTLFWKHFEKLM